jgi:hypothetical protein
MSTPTSSPATALLAVSRLGDGSLAPAPGEYLTDGRTLFRVEHALADPISCELFLELENCQNLEMVLHPARALMALGLRPVTPAAEVAGDLRPHAG